MHHASRDDSRQVFLQVPGDSGENWPHILAKSPPQTPEGRNHPVILQILSANQSSQSITLKTLDVAGTYLQNTG